jgi:hypothetical protein
MEYLFLIAFAFFLAIGIAMSKLIAWASKNWQEEQAHWDHRFHEEDWKDEP